jgi:leucine-rich repeat protein SHOC2
MTPEELEEFAKTKDKKLSLSWKNISYLPDSIFKLTYLKYIYAWENKLSSLPESIGKLINLNILSLTYNRLNSLPEAIGKLASLHELHLGFNKLRNIPESIGQLFNLKKLDLSHNQLINIPESIGQLINLENLNLSHNQLASIPESIGKLKNLLIFDLSNNQLTEIPESIGQLTNLVRLDLADNQLTELPDSIWEIDTLDTLIISSNQIRVIPKSISKLKDLTCICLDNNPLTDLSAIQSLPELEQVSFFDVDLPRRYWMKFIDWKAQWLLDEDNAEIRRLLIQQIGYNRICQELDAIKIDNWREYTLLKIATDVIVYDEYGNEIEDEPMVLLKMICPSTAHIHILRVPPEMTSAEAAIKWINHGIHPDDIIMQT